ncbi:MAG: hypothetical protein IPL95_09245 [Saprospiraceae bacterium]|nr:hypothetical protein [Saprospiraceae bacterium]
MNQKSILAIFLAFIWISISEFFRNSFLVHSEWINHFQNLGLIFPEKPVNGAIWGIWSFVFSIFLYIIYKRFNFFETISLGWVAGFLMMWLVLGNLNVLPFNILIYAVPLSIIEVIIAVYIISYFSKIKK